MRRLLLTLSLISLSGSAQPTQQQAQPPTIVQVEMPQTDLWSHLIELIVPGIVGAGGALLAVWLTNRANERANARTREHQQALERIKDEIAAEAKSRDNRWAFRKDVYSAVIKTICNLLVTFNESLAFNRTYLDNVNNPQQIAVLAIQLQEYHPRLRVAVEDYFHFANLSYLATADWVIPRIIELTPALRQQFELDVRSPDYSKNIAAAIGNLNTLLKIVSEAGRKDLWDTTGPAPKA